jgi:hypothetical protein
MVSPGPNKRLVSGEIIFNAPEIILTKQWYSSITSFFRPPGRPILPQPTGSATFFHILNLRNIRPEYYIVASISPI